MIAKDVGNDEAGMDRGAFGGGLGAAMGFVRGVAARRRIVARCIVSGLRESARKVCRGVYCMEVREARIRAATGTFVRCWDRCGPIACGK